MLKKRLIPVLLLQNGRLVRSEGFRMHQIIGDPVHEVERFNQWSVDELIYLDISREASYELQPDDRRVRGLQTHLDVLERISRTCFMPLTWGGRIRDLEQMTAILASGADKISINTAAVRSPELITRAAERFGSQAVVVSIDALRPAGGGCEVMIEGGSVGTGREPAAWAREAQERGAGEILLQSIDRDGSGRGYDLELITTVCAATTIPVIACGGVGVWEHYARGIEAGAAAVAAANIWHFKELADRAGKRALARAGVEVRL